MQLKKISPVFTSDSQSNDKSFIALSNNKRANINLFVKAVPHLEKIGKKAVYELALRFNVSPQQLQKRITNASKIGGKNEK